MKLVMRLAAIAGLALSVLATTASANLVKVILLGGQSNAVTPLSPHESPFDYLTQKANS